MLNKQALMGMWDMQRQRVGIGLRCVEMIPADKFDSHPIANMRSPKELLVHTYGMVMREMTEAVIRGEVKEIDEKGVVAGLKSRDDVLKYCRDCWNASDKAASQITDAQLAAIVKTPWGMDVPGWWILGAQHDEYLHHRGQLYTYLRQMGAEVPMMWDFEHNAPGFQPKQAQQA